MTSGIQAPLPLVLQRVVLRIREHNCVKVNGGYILRHADMQSTLHFSWMLGWPGESIAEFALLIHMVPCGFDSRCTEKEKKKNPPEALSPSPFTSGRLPTWVPESPAGSYGHTSQPSSDRPFGCIQALLQPKQPSSGQSSLTPPCSHREAPQPMRQTSDETCSM